MLLLPLALVALTAADAPVDYQRQVKPLLKTHCFSCHGGLAQKARLRVDTRAAMLQGGRKGPAIVPGQPEKSLLLTRVCATEESERMPPEGRALSPAEVEILRSWIRQGADAPIKEVPEEDPRAHWAYQPIRRPQLPAQVSAWTTNPIDVFVDREHARHGVKPAAVAPPTVLLRRAYLDLIGLPPTPDEVNAFLADRSPRAYERVVDQLLGRPQHGERWARHWMDVWRYSDWYGRRGVPDVWNSAPQVWRWRDWITHSLNADRGYARMLQEMIAADEIAPGDEDAVVATGYLVRNWYALNPNQWVRDVVEHTGKAFVGLTFQCAHCHDHKYDPISQHEYFRFRAFFEPIGLRQDRVRGEADPGPFQKYDYGVLRKIAKLGRVSVFDENPEAKTLMYHLGDERELMKDKPPVTPGMPAFLRGDRLKMEPVRMPREVYHPGSQAEVQAEALAEAERALATAKEPVGKRKGEPNRSLAAARLAALRARIAADKARLDGAKDAEELARQAAVAERKAGVGSGNRYTPLGPVYPATSTGRRKALAEWLADRDNPLVARVAVNHVWRWHFGKPLVETVADFGRNGKKPTHPELLDWLACELIESGWSLKHLHRLIVTSSTYRMHSAVDAASYKADPDNRWLTRFPRRRIEAEVVRDSMLFVAGELDLTLGGAPVENTVAETTYRRRSLYFSIYPEDGGQPRFLELFDAPDPCDCYVRSESVVPQQALALTNSALVEQLAATLTRQLVGQAERPEDVIRLAFGRVLSRSPSPQEVETCRRFLERSAERSRGVEGLVRALFSHEDFLSIR